jgi:tetratricopeptide (TPR) repeat protein
MLAKPIVPKLELIMRYSSVAAAAALTLLAISTSLHGQRPDDQIDPRSMALLAKGKAAQTAGNLDAATDALESALVVDPRNRVAFVTLGQVAEARGLPGKAIRLYREALLLEPNDIAALKGQGEALVAKGAVARARDNLAKIRTICGKAACSDATALAATIAKGPPIATASVTVPAAKPAGKE